MNKKNEKDLLLVDDEDGIRRVLSISLGDLGYVVHTAKNGELALKIFKEINPPIVITDIKMPGMDGIELLTKIKDISPETEVIMITGHGDIDLAIQSLKNEACDYVTKPIKDEVMEIALSRAHERIGMRNQIKEYTENLENLVAAKSKKLVEAERLSAVGQTVAGLSHAIKNIASGLKGGIFVLEKGIELDNKKYLMDGWGLIKGNVDKIKNLSLDLLDYAKTTKIEYCQCDPNLPAREVFELMKSRAQESEIDLGLKLANNVKDFYFDPEQIHRSLLNLVTNAIDACNYYTETNLKKKTIHIETRETSDQKFEYIVEDTCGGMTDKDSKKIFNRFFTTKGSKGTGIGLMLTKKIIDEHRGKIRVSSSPGEGTKFLIQIPKHKVNE